MEIYSSSKITFIYGLYEVGEENNIKYIGKSNNPYNRFRAHKCDKANTPKTSWIKSVYNRGSKISYVVLKVVKYENWEYEEIKLIEKYNRNIFKLKNYDKGGKGGHIKYDKSYEECSEWIKYNKPEWILTSNDYRKWCDDENFPSFLPIAPHRVFENFKWHIYLNTKNISTKDKNKNFYSYVDAKRWIKDNLDLKSSSEFRKSKLPCFIPKKPYNSYTNEWIGWSDFLEYKPFNRDKKNKYLSYEDSKKWIKDNLKDINTVLKYRRLSKEDKLPIFIHKKPEIYYKEWISWYDWLGKEKDEY